MKRTWEPAKIAITATCNAGGAGKWRAEHATYLKGADVVVIPDNDEPGRKYAEAVTKSLAGIAARTRILKLPGLSVEAADVSDWLVAGGTAEQLWVLLDQQAKQPEPDAAPSSHQQTKAEGDDPSHWNVVPWPEAVSGAELLDAICEVLRRYMILPTFAAEAIALWVLHSWTFSAWEISPLLILMSPTKQCGKSTLLAIIFWIIAAL